MDECEILGHEAFYGIGIRIGFYLQYITFIWASVNNKDDLAERASDALALWLFKFGAMVGLLHDITVTKYLEASEVYVVLLLLLRIPILRMIGLLFDLIADTRQPTMSKDDVSDSMASLALLIVDVGISAWFWFAGFQVKRSTISCEQVGFLFAKFDLATPWFRIVNLVCLFVFFFTALVTGYRRVYIDQRPSRNKARRSEYRYLTSIIFYTFEFFVAIAAIERTFSWNNISEVNSLTSAAQLIPFVIGLCVCVRAIKPFRMFWESIEVKELDQNAPIGQQAGEYQQIPQGGHMVVQNLEVVEPRDRSKPMTRFIWSVAIKVVAGYFLKILEP